MTWEQTIQKMEPEDWDQVRGIYEEGIKTGNATFETSAPSWEDWNASHLSEVRFVARAAGDVVGWAALSRVSERCVYDGVAEVSIYVSRARQGQGIGTALMSVLIKASECLGFWTLQAGIFPENTASLALHRRHEFREIGRRERIGQQNAVWRDTVLLERRSRVVGVN